MLFLKRNQMMFKMFVSANHKLGRFVCSAEARWWREKQVPFIIHEINQFYGPKLLFEYQTLGCAASKFGPQRCIRRHKFFADVNKY